MAVNPHLRHLACCCFGTLAVHASVTLFQRWLALTDTSEPHAGLDLENDAAAANTQGTDDFSTVSKPKFSLPPAKQSTLASAQHQTKHTHRAAPPRSQQQHLQQHQQRQQTLGLLEQAVAASGPTRHGASPKGWVNPAQRILPRAGIFYCGSFSASCGLPKHSKLVLYHVVGQLSRITTG